MNPVLFALVDAVLWDQRCADSYNAHRLARAAGRRAGDARYARHSHLSMMAAKAPLGAWRSLWGLL